MSISYQVIPHKNVQNKVAILQTSLSVRSHLFICTTKCVVKHTGTWVMETIIPPSDFLNLRGIISQKWRNSWLPHTNFDLSNHFMLFVSLRDLTKLEWERQGIHTFWRNYRPPPHPQINKLKVGVGVSIL